MTHTTAVAERTAQPWWLSILRERSVQLTLAGWLVISIAVPILAGSSLPFDRPSLEGQPVGTQIVNAQANLVLALMVIALAYAATGHRVAPDIAARAPSRALAVAEVTVLVLMTRWSLSWCSRLRGWSNWPLPARASSGCTRIRS
jgi:hypothetical protein